MGASSPSSPLPRDYRELTRDHRANVSDGAGRCGKGPQRPGPLLTQDGFGVVGNVEDVFKLRHVVQLGTHGDIGDALQNDLDNDRDTVLGNELLSLGERSPDLVRVAHPQRLAAQAFGNLDVIDSVLVQLRGVHIVEAKLHAVVHVEAALGLSDQAEVGVVHDDVDVGQVELGSYRQFLDHELEVVIA